MAIEKLNFISVSGSSKDYSETLLKCISEPGFHMDDASELLSSDSAAAPEMYVRNDVNQYSQLLTKLDDIMLMAGIQPVKGQIGRQPLPESDAACDKLLCDIESQTDTWKIDLEQLTDEKSRLNATYHEDMRILDQLNHLKQTKVDLDKIFACEFFRFRFGYMPRESYDNLSVYTQDINDMFFFASSADKHEVWGLYFTPRTKSKIIDKLFESLHFERVRISERAHGTPAKAISQLEDEMKNYSGKLAEIDRKLSEYSAKITPQLLSARSVLTKLNRLFELQKRVVHIKYGFIITGWITDDRVKAFTTELEKLPTITCSVEKASCSNDVMPPTKLKNPDFLSGYEDLVKMYGVPSYNEIDPTPLVAITYFLFFGMMFGDVGQGAVIILAGALMWFWKKVSLGKVLMTVGVSSMIFGTFYGSVFGIEDIIHGFNPSDNINTVLVAAVGVGMFMIITVMILNIINGIRQKDLGKVLFSHNGIPGLIMYMGAVILVLAALNYIKFEVPVWLLVTLIIIALLAVFLREPLTKLVEGKKDFVPENKLDFALENFFELFEVALSFLTNTISFIRIGAFALSHVGMMNVVFLLAKTDTGHNPIILIIGNLFVIGFEGMIVCIQVLRLEFYELFGRFYTGDGRPFESAGDIGKN